MEIEELGNLFKGDPTFGYIFNELPRSLFLEIVKLRRKRAETEPQLSQLL